MYCLGIIMLLNLNQIHAMTYTGCIFIFPLNNTSATVWADLCIWGCWHASEKPKDLCAEMNFFEATCESLHIYGPLGSVAKFEAQLQAGACDHMEKGFPAKTFN